MPRCYIKDYPRPQFVRGEWASLNGLWNFAFDDDNKGETEKWFGQFPAGKEITVPFTYETNMSGIGDEGIHNVVWYSRTVNHNSNGKNTVIHFEGCDWKTRLWVNGQLAGVHEGGYTRFSFDITKLLTNGENTLTVRVEDSADIMQPRGKQRWIDKNFGCWYIQTTGIWKPVWLEYVNAEHIEKVKMTPKLNERALELEWDVAADSYGGDLSLLAEISFDGRTVSRAELSVTKRRGKATLDVYSLEVGEWGIKTWSPEKPRLYDICFALKRGDKTIDEAASYFGMREVRIENANILLNNRPIYQRLILDQGYWKNSHLTPPDEAAIIKDIDSIMAMGYNGVRKHQKIEDGRFAYWCDVKGLLMWCESPSAYEFGDDATRMFTEQWLDIVEQHYNHPSIITWTPFNESWGVGQIKTDKMQQKFTEAIYCLTKAIDAMRPVITNDGWEHTISDILTLHDYEELGDTFFRRYSENRDEILGNKISHNKDKTAFAEGYEYNGQPVIISEYGGAAYSGGKKGEWGYGNTVETEEQLLARIDDVTSSIKKLPWVCGYCYTQVTDVQQEINGLMDINRNFKADCEKLREINIK